MFTWGIEVNSEQFYLSHLECDFEEARRGQNPKMKILESQRGACHQTNIQHALSSKPSPFLLARLPKHQQKYAVHVSKYLCNYCHCHYPSPNQHHILNQLEFI